MNWRRFQNRNHHSIISEQKKYRKGQGFVIGLAINIPIGIPVGLAMGNIAIGPAIGVAIGIGLGLAFEESYMRKSDYEEISEENKKSKVIRTFIISLLAGCIFALLIIYLITRGN